MSSRMKLSHNRYSGRLRSHEYTSYLPLVIIIIVVGILLTISSVSALTPPPQAESIGLTGTMPEPPPSQAATIISPTNQQQFSATPISVTGTCPKQTIVEIYKNNIFAGSGVCTNNGSFAISIDLMIGQNSLLAKDYDALNQAGPNSNIVNVNYNVLPAQTAALSSLNLAGAQLLLNSSAVYRGIFPGQELSVPINIIGGTPPYAINIEWGDTTNQVVQLGNNTTYNASHSYQKPGIYQLTFQASDAQGRNAFLTVVSIVNGQTAIATTTSSLSNTSKNELLIIWPLYAIAATMVVSFWLGERREKHVLSNPTLMLHT